MTKHDIFMNIAKSYSNFSKCNFTKVGAIAINENDRIIATGVNGTIPGEENCCDHYFETRDDHIKYTLENEIHAEENMILELAVSSATFRSIVIYVTLSPCAVCLKHILGLTRKREENKIRIDKIIYGEQYHRTSDEELKSMKARAHRVGTSLLSLEEANELELEK